MNFDEPFKDHIATYERHGDHLETLMWKNPKSSLYAIHYVRRYSTLLVFGDCYEAVYQWTYSDRATLAWMAACDEGYFYSKCKASPHGRRPLVWDQEVAEKVLKDYFADEENKEEAEAFDRAGGWLAVREGTKFDYDGWLHENGHEVFGDDWWDSRIITEPGMRRDCAIDLHLKGLKAAFEQLKQREL